MKVTVEEIFTLDEGQFAELSELAAHEYVIVGNQSNSNDLITYFLSKHRKWLILVDGLKAGLIAVTPSQLVLLESGMPYSTSTYLFSRYRGSGVNRVVKEVLIQAYLHSSDLHLISMIRDWNVRSLRATQKLFPTLVPSMVESEESGRVYESERYYYLFNFSEVPHRNVLAEEMELFEAFLEKPLMLVPSFVVPEEQVELPENMLSLPGSFEMAAA